MTSRQHPFLIIREARSLMHSWQPCSVSGRVRHSAMKWARLAQLLCELVGLKSSLVQEHQLHCGVWDNGGMVILLVGEEHRWRHRAFEQLRRCGVRLEEQESHVW